MSENRACKKFDATDPTYEKTNCASCTLWNGVRCRGEAFVVASQDEKYEAMIGWEKW